MSQPGKQNLLTDVKGIRVGNAEDSAVRTGVTVILPDEACVAAVAVAGGGPGTRETDLLSSGTMVDAVNAICLSGGSAFGLAAADGVASALKRDGRGFGLVNRPGVPKTPIVPAAILYDLGNGGNKDWGETSPYAALGLQAYDAADQAFKLGPAGAGLGAMAGTRRGGLGSASIVSSRGITVGALAAVNSCGSVYMPGTQAFWSWPFEEEGEFGGVQPPPAYKLSAEDWGDCRLDPQVGENTTIACIATDAALTPDQAKRVAQMALSGFARAIRPVFAPFDGDAVFVLSTAQKPLEGPAPLRITEIGELAASTLTRAIARGVFEAR